jgi:hypothetical protein
VAGFSLIELSVAAVLVTVLAFLVSTLSRSGMEAQRYAERLGRVTEITQDLLDELRDELQSSVQLFTADTRGNAYLAMVDLTSSPTRISSALPKLVVNSVFEPETTPRAKTGNALLFARHAWTDHFMTTSGQTIQIDVYRAVHYYLHRAEGGPAAGRPDGLNLARWVSEPLADGHQVDGITDPAVRAEVLDHLLSQTPDSRGIVHDAVEVVWHVGADPAIAGTFRQIDTGGSLSPTTSPPRATTWQLEAEPRLCAADLLTTRKHSIASNFAAPSTGVGRFSARDPSGDGFPHGFEIQMIGPASARQILIHLTVVSANDSGRRAFQDLQVITDARDL